MAYSDLITYRSKPTYYYIGGPEHIFTVVIQGEETVLIPCKTKEIAKKYFTEYLDIFLSEEGLRKCDVENCEDFGRTYDECIDDGESLFCDNYNYSLRIYDNGIYEK